MAAELTFVIYVTKLHNPEPLPNLFSSLLLLRDVRANCFVQRSSTVLQTFSHNSAEPSTDTDESCFQAFALRHLDELLGYAMALTRNRSDADDLVQETYLRAAKASSRLKPDSHVRSWLYTILRNTFLNQVRRRRSGPALVEIDDDNASSPTTLADESAVDPLASYLTEEAKRDVRQAIDGLPSAFREVIVLREFHELSYGEIASVLNCPVGTVMSRLGRARDRLRQMLEHWNTEASR